MRTLLLITASFVIFALGCGGGGEKVYGVIDLVEKVTRDKAAWTGKEIVVSGYASISEGNTFLNLVADLHSGTEGHIYCTVPKASVTDDLD